MGLAEAEHSLCNIWDPIVLPAFSLLRALSMESGEARHRRYKRLKLGGGHAYDHSSV
jgi:hypothetical protein